MMRDGARRSIGGKEIMRACIITVLAVMLCASAARGDEIVPQPAAKHLLELTFSTEDIELSRDERTNLARSISAACKGYRRVVPTVTPNEEAWIRTEMGKDSSSERMIAAADTEIFARFKAVQFLDQCSVLTTVLVGVSDDYVAWATLAKTFVDNDISEHLDRIGSHSMKPADVAGARMMLGHYTASMIIERILIPALMK
jgi:hypothetical protein